MTVDEKQLTVDLLLDYLKRCMDVIEYAAPGAFENGVKDHSGHTDEGEVKVDRLLEPVRALLRKAGKT